MWFKNLGLKTWFFFVCLFAVMGEKKKVKKKKVCWYKVKKITNNVLVRVKVRFPSAKCQAGGMDKQDSDWIANSSPSNKKFRYQEKKYC